MKRLAVLFLASALAVCGPAGHVAAAKSIGIVKSVDGEVFIERQANRLKARVNTRIENGDIVQTGLSGRIDLLFEDDTVVSMGPAGKLVVDDFLFDPAEGRLSLVIRIIKGTLSFLSGQIARLAPENVHLETPDATIGMRGTRILVKVQ